jgi:hypothetical protein
VVDAANQIIDIYVNVTDVAATIGAASGAPAMQIHLTNATALSAGNLVT